MTGRGVPWVAACATAALSAAAIRPWGAGALALVAYVPVFVAISSTRNAALGALWAAAAALGVNSVAYEAARVLFPGAYPVTLVLSALPFALVGACAVRLRTVVARRTGTVASPLITLAALPVLWSAAEWLPAQPDVLGVWALPLGFIGYSQLGLPTAQVARFGSVSAVSMLVLTLNAGLAALWVVATATGQAGARSAIEVSRPRALRIASIAALVALVPPVGGAGAAVHDGDAPVHESGAAPGSALSVRIVQPHLTDAAYLAAKASSVERSAMRATLGEGIGGAPVDLVVLPEAAWPGAIDVTDPEVGRAQVAAAFGSATVLFGAPARSGGPGKRLSNSVFLWRSGVLEHVYAKRRTVPIAEASLLQGSSPAPFALGGARLAPLVCYDALFPSDVRALAAAGAQAIVLVTNDSFAAKSDIPELHLRAARMRALETGLPVVLASNTGPSAFISAKGEVVSRLDAGRPGALDGRVALGAPSSPYTRHGDWLGGGNAVIAGGLVLAASRGGRSPKRST